MLRRVRVHVCPAGIQRLRSQSVHSIRDRATDIQQYADAALASLSGQFDGFELIDKLSGKRGEWDGVMATVAWGEGAARMLQKLFYMLVCRKQCRVYILTTTDLLANAKQSAPVFDQMLRSFAPNEIQFIWGKAD
jgi:hypothetical protein